MVVLVAGGILAGCSDDAGTTAPTTTQRTITSTVTAPAGLAAGSAAARFCASGLTATSGGEVRDEALSEISGVAASRANAGTYWVHVDSEGPSAVWAIDGTGATRGRVTLTGATNVDWEDISVGPGPVAGTSYLFVADIGDNGLDRKNIQVYRLPEPALGATSAPFDVVTLRYPDRAHNAEAFFVHPTTGDWYLLTKEANGPSVLFRARKPGAGASTVTLEQLGSLDVTPDLVTAAAFAPDASAFVVRTYLSVRVFPILDGDVAAALGRPDCRGPRVRDAQGEAITFTTDGSALVTLSEGKGSPVTVIR